MTSRSLVAAIVIFLVAWTTAIGAPPQSAAELTENAARLIQEQDFERALQVLERAIEEDDEYWEAHYQRGRALALSGRMEEALEAFLRGCELNPGFAVGHQSAAVAAMQIEEYETAWDQAIRAYLAGADVSRQFAALSDRSEVPGDFDARINAWKVYVAGVAAGEAEARAAMPGQREELLQLIAESTTEFELIHRHLRNAISRSPHFGLVLQPDLAQYALGLSVDEISRRQPRSLEGYLRLIDLSNGEAVYYRPISLRNISAGGSLYAELERYVGDMAEWKQRQ